MTTTTVLMVHANPSVRGLYEAALAELGACRLYFINRGTSSSSYDESHGLASQYPAVEGLMRQLAPEWRDGEPLVGIGFSVGCYAYRAWLKDPENRRFFSAVVLIDGLRAQLTEGGLDRSDLEGVFAFARECRESQETKLLVVQNTAAYAERHPAREASTAMTARALLDEFALTVGSPERRAENDGGMAGVVVRAYPGTGPRAQVRSLMSAGPELVRHHVVPLVASFEDPGVAPRARVPPWKNPGFSLGERCLLLCQGELDSGVRANATGPNTSRTIAKYFAGAVRNGQPLPLSSGNWCMLAQSWVLAQCLLPGEQAPHEWRASVVEAVADAKELGLYHPVSDVRTGKWRPRPGDLAVWNRAVAERPETHWWRHVNRVMWFDDHNTLSTDEDTFGTDEDTFGTVGANEERVWSIAHEPPIGLSLDHLLGFIEYPRIEDPPLIDNAHLVAGQTLQMAEGEDPVAPESMRTSSRTPDEYRGIDVSHHHRSIDFTAVRGAGQGFVVCRATYGTQWDSCFAEYYPAAKAAGLRCGASHFLRACPDQPAEAQVDAFLGALDASDIAPDFAAVLDVGHNTIFDGPIADPALLVERVSRWLEEVRTALGASPYLRVNPEFWRFLGEPVQVAKSYPLWLAHYTSDEPVIPEGWKDYAVWQHTGTGHVDGVGTRVTMNVTHRAPWA